MRIVRLAMAAGLAVTGYLHADLYVHGYRGIAVIGPSFLLLASASFAIALLLLVGMAVPEPPLLHAVAAALASGALIGFALSRTIGLFGFVERGLQPSPQALLSVIAETAVLLLSAGTLAARRRETAARGGGGNGGRGPVGGGRTEQVAVARQGQRRVVADEGEARPVREDAAG